MSIKTKLAVSFFLCVGMSCTLGVLLYRSASITKNEMERQRLITEIHLQSFQRSVLRDEYLLYREERPAVQWNIVSKSIAALLEKVSFLTNSSEELAQINTILAHEEIIRSSFSRLVEELDGEISRDEIQQRLISEILITSEKNIAISSDLSVASRNKVIETQRRTMLIALASLVIIAVAISIIIYALWLSVAKPLIVLKNAAVRLAALDFSFVDFQVFPQGGEIGELGRAFRKTIEALRLSYAELEKFKLAVAGVSEHVIMTDPDGKITFVNEAAEKITGFSRKEILGKKAGAKELWGGLMDQEFYRTLWQTIKVKKQSFSGEIKNRHKDGHEYYAYSVISPILNHRGEVEFFVGIERDITREKEVDKAKTEFVSIASHQLRTPLTSLHWYSEMLLDVKVESNKKRRKEYLQKIHVGSERMIAIVNVLLNVSRIELGTLPVVCALVDVAAILREVIREQEPQTTEHRLSIVHHIPQNIPLVETDPQLLRMVFQNIFSNAVKYTPDGGSVTVSLALEKNHHLSIAFTDTGFGIPKKDQDKLFTKLFRADNVKKKGTDGNGLGLYIVKSVLSALGGTIRFISEENHGTTFFVDLPLSTSQRKVETN